MDRANWFSCSCRVQWHLGMLPNWIARHARSGIGRRERDRHATASRVPDIGLTRCPGSIGLEAPNPSWFALGLTHLLHATSRKALTHGGLQKPGPCLWFRVA
jgi:hypothetical protein